MSLGMRGKHRAVLLAVLLALGGCASSPEQPVEREPQPVSAEQSELLRRAQLHLQLAVGYYEHGQNATALEEIRESLQLVPDYADAVSVQGLIHMEMDQPRLAEESFRRALKLAPNNPDFANNYGWFLCQNGRERAAIPYFETALKNRHYQSPARALNNAGVCSIRIQDYAAAERYLTQALQYDPASMETNTNLAKLYYGRGEYQRARTYVSSATRAENPSADVLWTALKVERKLGDNVAAAGLATQLRRRYPNSRESAALLRGAFDE